MQSADLVTRGDGHSAEQLFGKKRSTCHAYTYDDVIIMPGLVRNSSTEVSLESRISKRVRLQVPLMSSPMDTVTEHEMAIGMALQGVLVSFTTI